LVQESILVRELNFKKQATCHIIGLVLSAILSVFLAVKGFGVYSIAIQVVSLALVTNLLFWTTSKWKPNGRWKKESFKKLWRFSSQILLSNIFVRIIDNIDNILIGKVFSTSLLGYFVKAKSTKNIPEAICVGVLNSSSFPVLAKVSENETEFKRLHLKYYSLASFVFFPVILGLIGTAKTFIIILYTEKWLPSVPILQVLALASLFTFLGALFRQTIMAKGRSDIYLKLNIAKKSLLLLSIPFGLYFGLMQFIWAIVFFSLVGLIIDFWVTGKLLKIRMGTYLKIISFPLITSILMCYLLLLIGGISINNNLIILLLQLSGGILFYTVVSIIFRINEFYYIKEIALGALKKQLNRLVKRN
jgi:O-antigen/teichoic acid export membrane protein